MYIPPAQQSKWLYHFPQEDSVFEQGPNILHCLKTSFQCPIPATKNHLCNRGVNCLIHSCYTSLGKKKFKITEEKSSVSQKYLQGFSFKFGIHRLSIVFRRTLNIKELAYLQFPLSTDVLKSSFVCLKHGNFHCNLFNELCI